MFQHLLVEPKPERYSQESLWKTEVSTLHSQNCPELSGKDGSNGKYFIFAATQTPYLIGKTNQTKICLF